MISCSRVAFTICVCCSTLCGPPALAPIGTSGATARGVPVWTNNRRKSCNNDCRNSSFFNRSLHQYCRAVAGTSASGEDYCVNILFFEHLRDGRTSLVFEFLLVSAAAHESGVYRSAGSDEAFCCQLMDSVDGEHAIDVFVNITVVISTMGYHQITGWCGCSRFFSMSSHQQD